MSEDNYGLKLTQTRKRETIQETKNGVYLWQMPNGSFVSSDGEHFYMIESVEGDQAAIRKLARGIASFGIDEGGPVFFPGNRIVTDEEYEHQKQRLDWGLTPDPVDAAREALKHGNRRS